MKNKLMNFADNCNKYTRGKTAVIGGSTGMTGAVCLASRAASRSGCGLVCAVVPEELNSIFEICLKEVMTYPLDDENGVLSKKCEDKIFEKIKTSDVVLFGCGLSISEDIKYLMEKLVCECNLPLIIDEEFVKSLQNRMTEIVAEAKMLEEETTALVDNRL